MPKTGLPTLPIQKSFDGSVSSHVYLVNPIVDQVSAIGSVSTKHSPESICLDSVCMEQGAGAGAGQVEESFIPARTPGTLPFLSCLPEALCLPCFLRRRRRRSRRRRPLLSFLLRLLGHFSPRPSYLRTLDRNLIASHRQVAIRLLAQHLSVCSRRFHFSNGPELQGSGANLRIWLYLFPESFASVSCVCASGS